MASPTAPQPDPIPDPSKPDVWLAVIEDMKERREVGIERYGTPLQPHNGRSSLVDAYQEALDLAVYLRQKLMEEAGDLEPVSLPKTLAGRIRHFRELRGFSLDTLSERSGLSKAYIWELEVDHEEKKRLSVHTAVSLADALAVDLEVLLGRRGLKASYTEEGER